MWHFNGEDDATRCGRKGPDSTTALVKIPSDLYKGGKEEFARIKPRDGFSMLRLRVCSSSYVFDLSLTLLFLIWHDLDVSRALLI